MVDWHVENLTTNTYIGIEVVMRTILCEKTVGSIWLVLLAYVAICSATEGKAQGQSAIPGVNRLVAGIEGARRAALVTNSVKRRWWRDKDGAFHFDKGKRWVPRQRGASLQRAQELGLTSLKAIRDILRNAPSPELLAAAGDLKPKDLLWPVVKGTWGRGFGYTRKLRPELHHNGVDIGAPEGAAVRASADGIVIYSDNELEGYGNCVIIVHPNAWVTLYAHNLRNTVQPGWKVKRGERIALIGSTGASWGPHLHFEMRRWGNLINPAGYFKGNRSLELNGMLVELPQQVSPVNGKAAEPAEDSAKDRSNKVEDAEPEDTKTEVAVSEDAEADDAKRADNPLTKLASGSSRSIERFLRRAPSDREIEAVSGRINKRLLWPVRGGGEIVAAKGREEKTPSVTIASEVDKPVRAAADGTVVWVGDNLNNHGKSVVILHRNGWVTVYGSLDSLKFKPGDLVKQGSWLGRTVAAESGLDAKRSSRLFFELRQSGKSVDPTRLFVKLPVDAPSAS
jgi:murein DD-endopeptidase MepM/ murein hydrolase activator NlpD